MSYQETMLKEIADAIREKEGSSGYIPATQFAARIRALEIGMDTYDADAQPRDILAGKTAYVRGRLITGTIPEIDKPLDAIIMPGTDPKTVINAGYYTRYALTVRGDSALIPENIRKYSKDGTPISIFGVYGSYTGG